jgi:hypothetical protein
MKVTANRLGFDNIKLRQPGETFDFNVVVNKDGSNNLGSWMDISEQDKDLLARGFTKAPDSKPKK